MIRMFAAISVFLLLFSNMDAKQLPFRNFSIQSGLSQSVVNDIYQDREGYIWIATEYGLNRFNRHEFVTWYVRDGLSHNHISKIIQTSHGDILVGTPSGLDILINGKFESYHLAGILRGIAINEITEDHTGGVWVGTETHGAFYFKSDTFTEFSERQGLSSNSVRKIAVRSDGAVWFGTSNGITELKSGRVRYMNEQNGLSNNRVRDIHFNSDESVWVATRDGITIFKNDIPFYILPEDGLIYPRVNRIISDLSGGVWVATENGASHFKKDKIINYSDDNGLANNIINAILIDYEENIWFGTYGGGVDLLPGEKFIHYDISHGLLSNMVSSVTQDLNQNIWVGTFGGGVSKLSDGIITSYRPSDGLIDTRVYKVHADKKNRIWVGTRNGISIFENGRFRDFNQVLPDPRVRVFFEDTRGNMWIGTYGGGLAKYKNDRFDRVYTTETGLADNIVMQVIEDDRGRIWAATYGGVSIIDDGHIQNITVDEGLVQNTVLSVFKDSRGWIWAGTFAGISIFKNGEIENLTIENGLPNNVCYFISEDEWGRMWIGTNAGLVRLDPDIQVSETDPQRIKDLLRYKIYTTESGLNSDEMNSNAIMKDVNGDFWFGSVGGLTRFQWRLEREVKTGPMVHIENIKVFDGDRPITEGMQFTHDQNFIAFEFVGMSFTYPSEVLYEYRLRGIDQDWQQTKQRSVRYTTLPDGDFRFEVRARNSDGYWSDQRASLQFVILPPFWKSWWFITLGVLFIIGFIFFLYNYYRIAKLIDLERIRIKIASDLHDDVGASLTEIALQADFVQATESVSDLKDSVKQIGEMSRKIVTTMDDIVWSIDARNDKIGDLMDRMQDYATNVMFHKNIEVEFDFHGFETNRPLLLEVRQNLYLIFKESINNAAKHSGATKVLVNFHRSGSGYELTIKDNGKGLPESVRSGGHGLKNMKMRAERIGARLNYLNEDGLTIQITGKGI